MPSAFLIVLTTLPNRSRARALSRKILRARLAACVNILGPAESFFWWKKKIDHAKEFLLLIKTRASHFDRLRRFIEKNHPYSVPEIVALPIKKGNATYLDWIKTELNL